MYFIPYRFVRKLQKIKYLNEIFFLYRTLIIWKILTNFISVYPNLHVLMFLLMPKQSIFI